jgi:hypothetical protein
MTIELITGAPGAGKTTFAVASRLVAESKRTITLEERDQHGQPITVERRLCVAGIRGLVMDHERLPHKLTGDQVATAAVDEYNRMDPHHEDRPVHQRLPGEPPQEPSQCLVQNWWLWCRPGDLIVVDEAQFLAPRGTMGKKPPYWVQALEIHRHYGVDFIFITQHPGLIDAVIKALVGLHRHVRSVMGTSLCMVYVWDHASNPERFTLANKTQFLRRKEHFKLFHSSVAHLKPPSSGRSIVFVLPVLLAVFGFMGWKLYAKWRPGGTASVQAAAQAASGPSVGAKTAVMGVSVTQGVAGRPKGWSDVPELSGCYAVGDECTCLDRQYQRVRIELAMCKRSAGSYEGLVRWAPSTGKRYEDRHAQPVAPSAAASSAPPAFL